MEFNKREFSRRFPRIADLGTLAAQMLVEFDGVTVMYKIISVLLAGAAIFTVPAAAQNSRRALIRGNGNPNEGKCTIEVVVDGAADVEIRGDNATLRNLNGQPPQWRRFE